MKTYLTKYLQRENVQIYGITSYLYVHYKYIIGMNIIIILLRNMRLMSPPILVLLTD